jgi:hypothetical protein
MPLAAISFRAWSIVVSAAVTPAPDTLMRNAKSFARTARERHHPASLAPSQHADLCALDIAAGFQVLEGGEDVPGQITE